MAADVWGTRPIRRLRGAAIARALLLNGLTVDELAAAGTTELGHDAGHRVLTVIRKGGRTRVPLAPATTAALAAYLTERATHADTPLSALAGPLFGHPHRTVSGPGRAVATGPAQSPRRRIDSRLQMYYQPGPENPLLPTLWPPPASIGPA